MVNIVIWDLIPGNRSGETEAGKGEKPTYGCITHMSSAGMQKEARALLHWLRS